MQQAFIVHVTEAVTGNNRQKSGFCMIASLKDEDEPFFFVNK